MEVVEAVRYTVLAFAEFLAHIVSTLAFWIDGPVKQVTEEPSLGLQSVDFSVMLDVCRLIPDMCQRFV